MSLTRNTGMDVQRVFVQVWMRNLNLEEGSSSESMVSVKLSRNCSDLFASSS